MKRAYANRDEIATLNVEADYLRIYQLTTLYDFATDARVGLNLAFYRIFAIPRMAELLVKTGEMTGRPTKRAYDTGLVMYELIANGFDHPRGREMVRLLNRVHKPWPIEDEDFEYVLAAFIVVPIRWIERRGWRPLLPAEREASVSFYRELGKRMKIAHLPQSYKEAEQILDSYERKNMAPSDAGRTLMRATQEIVVRKLPKPFKRLGTPVTSALIGESRLANSLGLPAAHTSLSALIDFGFQVRNLVRRQMKPASAPWFVPGRSVSTLYPGGYNVHDLGPTTPAQDPR